MKNKFNPQMIIGVMLILFLPLQMISHTLYSMNKYDYAVSANAMNVFYIGVDNPITAVVSNVDPSLVDVSVFGAGASLHPINGSRSNFNVRVTTPGEVTVTVSVKSEGQTTVVGSTKFRVRRVPQPIALANGIDEHTTVVDKNLLENSGGLIAIMKDFDFAMHVEITSFTMATVVDKDFIEFKATTGRFTPQMINSIKNAERGQKIFFENIIVQMPTGPEELRGFTYTIK
ncbi:MAG: hypothetical protein LBP96_02330 [Bacteroidales bacterium]|jgi:hypothetical protein|nr:hypothetical protein [Bacteroidales bacterium]